jgi:ribosomal protein L11 methyltransferase
VSTSEIADDWSERWREFHQPLALDDRLCVRPPWAPESQATVDVVIDPGQAFGTGAHATTRLCLELMLDRPSAAGPFVDLGCGSGVLAIAAAKLGWAPVLALDYDQLAVDATVQNAAVNGVDDRIDVRRFNLMNEPVPPAPLVLANLLGPLLLAWSAAMAGTAHSWIVASGLLESEAVPVSRSFALHGYRESRRLISGEWAALLMEAPARG